uniref:STI1 domain-containing protein n=1 Tax=Chaetoceros debilis TaxID=122233 RepID=A0A7S3PXZ6_9STRA
MQPCSAQFGVGNKMKQGGTFQELNEQAAGGGAGVGAGAMAGAGAMNADMMAEIANMDSDDLMKMLQESMNDPATMEYMNQMGAGMEDVMQQLAAMDPAQMKQQITDNLATMTSDETLNSVLEQSDEVLESLLMQGLITEEQMLEFQEDPAKFQEQMSQAFEEMNKILSDPEALDAAMNMMNGMADMMANPDAAMAKLAEAFSAELGDDDKIEEARLQLLADPDSAGNPTLASLFQDQNMKEILEDPVLWREQVKLGQEMLAGGGGGLGGAGLGEL